MHSKEVDAFILKIKVGVMCSCTTKLHENLDILIPMDLWSPNFNGGCKKYMGIFVMEILILLCITQLTSTQ